MVNIAKMFTQSARLIADAAKGPQPIAVGIGRWFDYCERVAPQCRSIWKQLRTLDFEEDAAMLTKWLDRLLRQEPPPSSINGFWFGLWNPVLDDGQPSCQMYAGGSAAFKPDSDSNEWVCQLSWLPEGRYSTSQVLAELYRSVETLTANKVNYLGEAFLCHGYLALVVSKWCFGPMSVIMLGNAPLRAVAMGHDSGDFYRMAVLRAK